MKIKDAFKDALPLIEQYAPTIASAIGGPFGMAAGYIIPILTKAFDADGSNVTEVATKMIQDPDMQNKLIDIESKYSGWLNMLMRDVNNLAKAEINIKLEWQADSNN